MPSKLHQSTVLSLKEMQRMTSANQASQDHQRLAKDSSKTNYLKNHIRF